MPGRSLELRVAALEKTVEKLAHVKASAADKRELSLLTRAIALARRDLGPELKKPARSHARARRTLRR